MGDRDDELTEVVRIEALQSGHWTVSDMQRWVRMMSSPDLMQRFLDRVNMSVPEETRTMLDAFAAQRPFAPVDGILNSMTPWERVTRSLSAARVTHGSPVEAASMSPRSSGFSPISCGSGMDAKIVSQ